MKKQDYFDNSLNSLMTHDFLTKYKLDNISNPILKFLDL